jgi:hypothetical protein
VVAAWLLAPAVLPGFGSQFGEEQRQEFRALLAAFVAADEPQQSLNLLVKMARLSDSKAAPIGYAEKPRIDRVDGGSAAFLATLDACLQEAVPQYLTEEHVPQLIKAARNAPLVSGRNYAISFLTWLKLPQAIPALQQLASDPGADPSVRRNAARAAAMLRLGGAVEKGLAWLIKQQRADGSFANARGENAVAMTALCGLALLGSSQNGAF